MLHNMLLVKDEFAMDRGEHFFYHTVSDVCFDAEWDTDDVCCCRVLYASVCTDNFYQTNR